jgi:hypothetical protein
MPSAEMTASATHRQRGFDPQCGEKRETGKECARTMRRRSAEKDNREQDQPPMPTMRKKAGVWMM